MGVDGFVFYYCIMLFWLSQAVAASKEYHCQNECGNISVPYPFGIGRKECYLNTWFEVTCKKTAGSSGREKPFLKRLELELLYAEAGGQNIAVNYPVIYLNCGNNKGIDGGLGDFNAILKGSPFSFSTSQSNYFGSVGCNNLATLFSNGIPFSGCLQPGCHNGYCYTSYMPENVHSLAVNITPIFPDDARDVETDRCSSAFIFCPKMMYSEGIGVGTTHVPAMLEWDAECNSKVCRKQRCTKRCGDAVIEFPFGIEDGCYMNHWFKVSCNTTDKGIKKAFININKTSSLELLNTSVLQGQVVVNNPITYSKCHSKESLAFSVDLTSSPFLFSQTSNVFAYVGCGNLATIFHHNLIPIGGCLQANCSTDGTLSFGTCDLSIPPATSSFAVSITQVYPANGHSISCPSAFMIDWTSWDDIVVSSDDDKIINGTHLPVALQFGQPKVGLCEFKDGWNGIQCSSDFKYCWKRLSPNHLCACTYEEYTNNNINVCRDKGTCRNIREYNKCFTLCLNEPGNYCSPPCPEGHVYDKIQHVCKPKRISIKDSAILIGCSTSLGTLLLLFGTWCLYKVLKRRRNIKRKQRYFKNNGGLLLQKQLSRNNEGNNIEKLIRFFTSKELEKATDHYNENRIIGQGGQGTVYKGMLADGRIVAVKKSKITEDRKKRFSDEKNVEQWVNEVMILSQVNHRNVVKLLGCCLETRFPLLVYEFIPNGTLFQMIHDQSEEFPLTWDMRLQIAIEVTNALAYLHSAASVPIYHRDIKSTNILLDDKYRAKVSDFGISKFIGLEQTHLTTQVKGTFGYFDPEYFRSNQFTEKSDVYSFGVVLAELLTGQKPVSIVESYEEVGSLVHCFLLSMKESSLFDILDPRLKNDGPKEEIVAAARLARRCLNLKGKKRPTMKQVAMELESIRSRHDEEVHFVQQISDADEDSEDDCIRPFDIASCSTTSIVLSNNSVTLPLLVSDA